jgi:hypothetical protein
MKYKTIVICGFGRSGSTLLYTMLRNSVQNFGFFNNEMSIWEIPRPSGKITKFPADVYSINRIVREIPDVGIILCIRDLRSLLVSKVNNCSEYKQGWNYRYNKTGYHSDAGLLKLNDFCVRALEFNPYVCRYERLVTNTDEVQEELRERFGFRYKRKFKDFWKNPIPVHLSSRMNGVRPVSIERIESWKEHPQRIQSQFTECPALFDIVKFWGYAENDKWYNFTKTTVKEVL